MQRGSASLKRIHELMTERPSIVGPEGPKALPSPLRGDIEFRG